MDRQQQQHQRRSSTSLFKYVRKEKVKRDVIILSSDEEDNFLPSATDLPTQKTEGSQSDPIALDDSDEEMFDAVSTDFSERVEELEDKKPLLSSLLAQFDLPASTLADQVSSDDDFAEGIMSDLEEHDPIFQTHHEEESRSAPSIDIIQGIKRLEAMDIQQSSEKKIKLEEQQPIPPAATAVQTWIPPDMDPLELLRLMDVYLHSIADPATEHMSSPNISPSTSSASSPSKYPVNETRSTRRNMRHHDLAPSPNKPSHPSMVPLEKNYPYVPNQVWYHSTWEDWAQLDVGDVLHCPFTAQEIQVLSYQIEKYSKRSSRSNRDNLSFWDYVATMLPGRTSCDCKWFWIDYREQVHNKLFSRVVVIRRRQDTLRDRSRHQLLIKRGQTGSCYRNALKKIHWSNMSKEDTIGGGSGDAITLTIFRDPMRGVKIVAGSLCDENIQYNMPGNLRLWDSDTKTCVSMNGHQTPNEVTGQNIWRTVTDVKMSRDETLIFSASHDGSANIWRSKTGKLVSTLRYHCKPINQLAVNYAATGQNVLATCSNDGTATVWTIGLNGKTGSGVICELDTDFYSDPHIDCIEFGQQASDSLLFLGINNKDIDHPGYVEAYDTATGAPRVRFDSMMGSVSTLAISKSGRFIVSGNYNRFDNMSGDGFIHLHDIRKSNTVSKFYSGHPDVNVVAISPCERYVASGNADKEKSEVVIFDIRNPKRSLHTLSHDQTKIDQSFIAPDSSIGIGGLYWMSDSRSVITGGGDSFVKVWSIEGATDLLKSYPTSNCVTSLAVNEETMTIAAGVAGAQGVVHVWQP
ncbi:Rik1-associated factor 1 [Choanephora cucurbitarum]|uniref:Rik1-associated factor 1 n=1 Tax=Choanephora cucurbitarum TaxID=101091 RepID=A0A1C7NE35_9FUNG|nr:Rik1-associated factor 1 [Choanephora cucurbitarum]